VARRAIRAQLVDRDELVEDAVVEDQAQEARRRVAEGEEPLRAGVALLEADVGVAEDLANAAR
jgi:hypothetical protein